MGETFKSGFMRFSKLASRKTGSSSAFMLAVGAIILWGVTGPIFDYSDTWQLIINTTTTIITFLMVFLIQNTQNRDGMAIQIKLDEIIRSTKGAHTVLMDLEELSDEELDAFQKKYCEIAQVARKRMRNGGDDTDNPRVDVNPQYKEE